MLLSISTPLAAVAAMAVVCAGAATPYHQPKGLAPRSPVMARRIHNPLRKRFADEVDLSVFSLTNQVLFEGDTGPTVLFGNEQDQENAAGNTVNLTCNTCSLEGQLVFKVLEDVQQFFDDAFQGPINPIEDAVNLGKALGEIQSSTARVELMGFKANVDLGLSMSAGDSFELTLLSFPIFGVVLPPTGDTIVEAGLIAALDLLFSADGEIDLSGGFSVSIPDNAFFELDINNGEIKKKDFLDAGIKVSQIPITVNSGTAQVKASLRLRVQVGLKADIPGPISGGVDVGAVAFANIVELVGTLNKTETCDLEADILFDINVGASLKANFNLGIDFAVPAPSFQTTLVSFDLFGPTCVLGNGTAQPTGAITLSATTTAEPITTGYGNYSTSVAATTTTLETTTVTGCAPSGTTIFVTSQKSNATIETTSSESVSTSIFLRKCLVSVAPGGNCPIDQLGTAMPGAISATTTASGSASTSAPTSTTVEASTSESTATSDASGTVTESLITTVVTQTAGVVVGDDSLTNGTVGQVPSETQTGGLVQFTGGAATDRKVGGSAMALLGAILGTGLIL